MEKIFKCDHCGSIIPKDPEINDLPLMLMVRDDIWGIISKGKKDRMICPDCMVKIWGRKFNYEELKKFSYGFIPCNLWYIRRNGFIPKVKEDLDYKEIKLLSKKRRESYFEYMNKLLKF
jgi:hypothetical protein